MLTFSKLINLQIHQNYFLKNISFSKCNRNFKSRFNDNFLGFFKTTLCNQVESKIFIAYFRNIFFQKFESLHQV